MGLEGSKLITVLPSKHFDHVLGVFAVGVYPVVVESRSYYILPALVGIVSIATQITNLNANEDLGLLMLFPFLFPGEI